MTNRNEEIIQTNNENSIERRKKVYENTDYGDLTLVELKFEEMNREVGRIREIVQSVKEKITALVNAINKLAGLVEAPTISIDSSTKNIDMQMEIIENFVNEQISRYTEINEFTSEQIDKLINLLDELFDENGQLITYEVDGKEVTESFTALLNSKEKEEEIKNGIALVNMIIFFEGSTEVVGDKYKVQGDPGAKDCLAVGNGLLLSTNANTFAEFGIDVSKLKYGDLVDKATVDAVRDQVINDAKNYVVDILEQNDIVLNDYQIDALVSRKYNLGNIIGFVDAYKKYGNTEDLYNNWFYKGTYTADGDYSSTLAERRLQEWNLFHFGTYPNEQ